MEINAGASGSDQLFAVMPVDRSVRNGAMVSLLANWSNKGRREIQLEIRSDEPMLRRSTRCQRVSNLLQQQLRPA